MNTDYYMDDREREYLRRRRAQRLRRQRQLRRRRRIIGASFLLICAIVAIAAFSAVQRRKKQNRTDDTQEVVQTVMAATTDSSEAASEGTDFMTASSQADAGEDTAVQEPSSQQEDTQAGWTQLEESDPMSALVKKSFFYETDSTYVFPSSKGEDEEDSKNLDTNGDGVVTFEEEGVASKWLILADADTGEIIAERDPYERICPASMTKVLTVLVAVEQMQNPQAQLDELFTLTTEIEDFAYISGSSAVCWLPGDVATIRDLLYGTVLPSGADAALALAIYTSGSQEAFVELMNQKLEELGISDTAHFTNCVGLYDENHYCSVHDMAVIMKAAVENDICREVMAGHVYTTSPTSAHPEGIEISNWFLRRIEDKDSHGLVLCAKTGYVSEAGYCAVSYQNANSGRNYICVTADAWSSWRCIYDHVMLYADYAP